MDARPGALRHLLPGDEVGVVLGDGDEDLVSLAEVRVSPGAREQVDALGGVAHEDERTRAGSTEETGYGLTRLLVQVGGFGGELMRSAVDVGVVLAVVVIHRIEHGGRSLRGGGVIEIHECVVMHRSVEDGKVATSALDVERRHARQRSRRCVLASCRS